jgi:hypothetical protein
LGKQVFLQNSAKVSQASLYVMPSAIAKLFLDKKWHFYHPALFFPLTQYRRINNRKIGRILELIYWKIIQRKKKRFFTQISLAILVFFST